MANYDFREDDGLERSKAPAKLKMPCDKIDNPREASRRRRRNSSLYIRTFGIDSIIRYESQ